jgi:1,6-anhydro-N-acetylmuramate kinase
LVLFRHPSNSRAIQNIGGISNVTYLPAQCTINDILAFDTGPGNMVIDGLVSLLTNGKHAFDPDGRFAAKAVFVACWPNARHPFSANAPQIHRRKNSGYSIATTPQVGSSLQIRDEPRPPPPLHRLLSPTPIAASCRAARQNLPAAALLTNAGRMLANYCRKYKS